MVVVASCSTQPDRSIELLVTPSANPVPISTAPVIEETAPGRPENPATPVVEVTPLVSASESFDLTDRSELISLCSPIEGITLNELPEIISAPYDPPPPGREERHHGVDFSFYQRGERSSIEDIAVLSVLPGTVAAALNDRYPYGNMLIIETQYSKLLESIKTFMNINPDESVYLLYAHMAEAPAVVVDEMVEECQIIGMVGKSGNAGISHLHLEARLGPQGARFPSMAYYFTQSTQEERDAYEYWRTSGTFRHFDPMGLLTILVE